MQLFNRRPLCVCCLAFCAVAIVGTVIEQSIQIAIAAVSLLTAVIVFVIMQKERVRHSHSSSGTPTLHFHRAHKSAIALVMSLFIAVASFGSYISSEIFKNAQTYISESTSIEAYVTDRTYSSPFSSGYYISISHIGNTKLSHEIRAVLDCSYPSDLQLGDRFSAELEITEISDTSYTVYTDALRADGILIRAVSDDGNKVNILSKESNLGLYFKQLNADVDYLIRTKIGSEEGKLASALLLGTKSNLPDVVTNDFRRAGISHILALSGLHISIIAMFLEKLLLKLGTKRQWRITIVGLLSILYLALTGFSASTVRAVIMMFSLYTAYIVGASSDSLTALFSAATIIIAFSPNAVFDCGLWLSVCATFGIILCNEAIIKFRSKHKSQKKDTHPKHRKTRIGSALSNLIALINRPVSYITFSVASTLAAMFSVLILSWILFGEVSIISPLTNILASPLTFMILILLVISLPFLTLPAIGSLLAAAIGYPASLMIDLASYISDLRGIVISLRYPFATIIILLMCAITFVLLVIKLKHKSLILLPPCVAVLSFAICLNIFSMSASGTTDLSYIRSDNDELIVFSNEGLGYICDISLGKYSNYFSAVNELETKYATEVEALILTHYHARHSTSISRLFASSKIRKIYLPKPLTDDDTIQFRNISDAAAEHRVSVITYSNSLPISLGNVKFSVSGDVFISRTSHPLLSLEIRCGTDSLAYIGASALETGGDTISDAKRFASGADYVILGAHGPAPQKFINLDFLSQHTDKVIFTSEDTKNHFILDYAFLPSDFYSSDHRVDCTYCRIILN